MGKRRVKNRMLILTFNFHTENLIGWTNVYICIRSHLRAEPGISSTSLILLEKFSDKSWMVLRGALIDIISIFVNERVGDTWRSTMSFLSRIIFLYALIDASRYFLWKSTYEMLILKTKSRDILYRCCFVL